MKKLMNVMILSLLVLSVPAFANVNSSENQKVECTKSALEGRFAGKTAVGTGVKKPVSTGDVEVIGF